MSDMIHVELTDKERKVLLRGLRYVRSSIMLETRDPSEADEAQRRSDLQAIAQIVDRLNSAPSISTADI